jgi:hypothetical protein
MAVNFMGSSVNLLIRDNVPIRGIKIQKKNAPVGAQSLEEFEALAGC